MDKILQQWKMWDIPQRRQFLTNAMVSLFVTGMVVPIIFGVLAVVFDSYKITAWGSAASLSIELMAINLCIWKKFIENLQ